jgi:biopolymer transport protein TolQ
MPHELGGPGTMGVADLLLGTGPVVQVVLWTLVLFSVVSWGIIVYKLNQISHARRESERFISLFWESKNLAAIHSGSVGLTRSPVAQVFRAGYQELLQLTRAMRRQANVETTKLEKGITFLATTGSTCPFIGLFGTVWGIMTAFIGLSAAHSSNIQAVAPGIAEALITTAIGLVAAIPAQMLYNYFIARVRELSIEMENFTSEFLNIAERHFLS